MLFDGEREFKRGGAVFRWTVRDGNDYDLRFAIPVAPRG